MDIEAELLEIDYDWTNKCVLYVVYIGEGLIKLRTILNNIVW